MNSLLSIAVFVVALVSPVLTSNRWSDFADNDIYPAYNLSNCVFPFNYSGQTYYNCTTDGTNGDRPWCGITGSYVGLFTQCYDVWKSSLKCAFPFTLNGVSYNKCIYFNRNAPFKQCYTNHPVYQTRYCIEEHVNRSTQKLFHPDQCDPAYKSLSNVHSRCAGPHELAFPKILSDDDKQSILDTHNSYRASVNASNMLKMYWDDDLAQMAQTHSNMCAFDHDLAENRLVLKYKWKNGQNMVMVEEDLYSSSSDLLTQMFDAELVHFFFTIGCKPDGSCLHYTQLMLNDLTRVGCAETLCLFPEVIQRYLTCNYIKSQYTNNYMTPYKKGVPCGDCPLSKNTSLGLDDPTLCLCDCGNKICNYINNEILNVSTCQCQSSKRSYEQDGLAERDIDGQSEVVTDNEDTIPMPIPHKIESKRELNTRSHRRPRPPHKRNQWQDQQSFADDKRDVNEVPSGSPHHHRVRPNVFPSSPLTHGWHEQRRQVAGDIDAMIEALEANMEDK